MCRFKKISGGKFSVMKTVKLFAENPDELLFGSVFDSDPNTTIDLHLLDPSPVPVILLCLF